MQTLYVMCGIPASGKSTLSKQISEQFNMVRLSLDEMGYVRQHKLISHVVNTLKDGKSVVADSLYTKKQWRTELFQSVQHIKCRCVLLYMTTSLDECIRRNQGRENTLPDFVIEHLYNSIEPPTLDEGWDEIIFINNDEDIKNLENNINNNIKNNIENLNLL